MLQLTPERLDRTTGRQRIRPTADRHALLGVSIAQDHPSIEPGESNDQASHPYPGSTSSPFEGCILVSLLRWNRNDSNLDWDQMGRPGLLSILDRCITSFRS